MADEKNEKIIPDRESMLSEIYDKIAYKELTIWCKVKFLWEWTDSSEDGFTTEILTLQQSNHKYINEFYFWDSPTNLLSRKIIWHNITLTRIMDALALTMNVCYCDWMIQSTDWGAWIREILCDWKTKNDNLSDAILDDQDIDTIKKLHRLLWIKKVVRK